MHLLVPVIQQNLAVHLLRQDPNLLWDQQDLIDLTVRLVQWHQCHLWDQANPGLRHSQPVLVDLANQRGQQVLLVQEVQMVLEIQPVL